MIEQVLAGAVLAVCAVLLLRLVLGEPRRRRFDTAVRRAWLSLKRGALQLWHWREHKRQAEQAAADAIERARRAGEWEGTREGNVYRPKSFREPRKPNKPH
jgi:hypothetical protein